MDPGYITSADWAKIGNWLTILWVLVAFNISFGFNFIMAYAIIPSLVGTGHLPQGVSQVRKVLYAGAAASLIGSMYIISRLVVNADVIQGFWDRQWI